MKSVLKTYIKIIIFYIKYILALLFSKTIRQQHFNPKCIPIFIISFNQLYYLKQLINFLCSKEYYNIIIIDNNSTYKPLLSYFEKIKNKVEIIRLSDNYGHLAFWKIQENLKQNTKGFYVVTDPDIVPVNDCHDDFMRKFQSILLKNPLKTKVGFSLNIDDLPDTNPNKTTILKWEQQFWKNETKNGNFKANIDTTFALYNPFYNYHPYNFYKAIRTSYPYTAIHGGWYVNPNDLTDEQAYYIKTTNASSSWLHSKEGKKIYNSND